MTYTLFLDIDGVLNQLQPWKIDSNCVYRLKQICDNLGDVNIILTSSWRKGFSRYKERCTPQVQHLLDELAKVNLKVYGRTKDLDDRQAEVLDYCTRYGIVKYIVLDDDKTLFKDMKNLYSVNAKTGLTDSDVKQLRKLYK